MELRKHRAVAQSTAPPESRAAPALGGASAVSGGTATAPPDARRRAAPESGEDREALHARRVDEGDEVVVTKWSWQDAIVSLIGAALTVAGLIALIRAGVDDSWFAPVTDVANANHTALLGAAEVGAGVLILLAGLFRIRVLAVLFGLALAIAGVVAALTSDELSRELAIEDWWAWGLAGAGLLVALMALVPRRGRVRPAEPRR